jgi:hypothetical protein
MQLMHFRNWNKEKLLIRMENIGFSSKIIIVGPHNP